VKTRALNVDGEYSQFSKNMIFELGPVPHVPSTPLKNDGQSSGTSIAVYWTQNTGEVLKTSGYRLYADNGLDDNFSLVFDGVNQPETVAFNFSKANMDTSLTYRFYVTGVNFNGEGAHS